MLSCKSFNCENSPLVRLYIYAYEYPLDVTCVIHLITFAFKQSGRKIQYVLEMHVAQPGEQSQATSYRIERLN